MPEVNRYSNMVEPLVVNPIGFEEFARLPIARAEAKGAAVSALDSIRNEYNVADVDLAKVNEMIQGIEAAKGSLVDAIATNGVSSNTVADIIRLKKERDDLYKNKIRQAEENKKLQFEFEQDIAKMYAGVDPEYANLIISKNQRGWKGTFTGDEKAPTQMFKGNYGAKYVDPKDELIKRVTAAAAHSDVTTTPTGGGSAKITEEKTEAGVMQFLTTPPVGSHTTETNEKQIDSAIAGYIKEAEDPNSEIGKFIEYVSDGDVKKKAETLASLKEYAEGIKKDLLENKNIRTIHQGATKQLVGPKNKGGDGSFQSDLVGTALTSVPKDERLENSKAITNSKIVVSHNKAKEQTKEQFKQHAPGLKVENAPTGLVAGNYLFNLMKNLFSNQVDNYNLTEKAELIDLYKPTILAAISNEGEEARKSINSVAGMYTLYSKSKNQADKDKYANKLLKIIQEQQDQIGYEIEANQSLITDPYLASRYGVDIKGAATKEAISKDLSKGYYNLIDYKEGKLISNEESDVSDPDSEIYKVNAALIGGKTLVTGIVPDYSPLLLRDGVLNEDMINGIGFKIDDDKSKLFQKQYIKPLPISERKTFEYQMKLHNHQKVMALAPGESTDEMCYVGKDSNGQIVALPAKVTHDQLARYNYTVQVPALYKQMGITNESLPINSSLFNGTLMTIEDYKRRYK